MPTHIKATGLSLARWIWDLIAKQSESFQKISIYEFTLSIHRYYHKK